MESRRSNRRRSISGGLMRIAAMGGAATPLTIATGATESSGYPQFLPDGRHIIYSRFGGNPNDNGVFVTSLDAKPEAQTAKRLLKDIPGPYLYPPTRAVRVICFSAAMAC